nr:pentatricopeptide repeat-containing protein At5g46460, mitochondrial [Ipomoea batatas]
MQIFPVLIKEFKFRPLYFAIPTLSRSITSDAKHSNAVPPTCYSILVNFLLNRKIEEAERLFGKIPSPSIYLCTKMIAGYAENGRLNDALNLFDRMPVKDVVMWNSIIKGCVECGNVEMGMKLLDEMSERNAVSYTTVINGLLRFGRVEKAEGLFREMPEKDVAAWNAMLYGYFENDRVEEAQRLFEMMPRRNVISWTSMVSGLDQHGMSEEALVTFRKMLGFGIKPNSNTFASVITACATMEDLVLGSEIHGPSLKAGFGFDAYVAASLITFYANCMKIDDSWRVFNEKMHMNVVVWTSLLTGYGLNHKHEDALTLFADMIRIGVCPNQSSFTSALNSSSEVESLDLGKEIHGVAVKLGFNTDAYVGNSLVVLYSKCGNMDDGLLIFKEIAEKNTVSWNSVIVGCAQHGHGKWSLALFAQMVRIGVGIDDITFTGLLSACSHSGMLHKGRMLFHYLRESMSMQMKIEHYACMVDILCRGGKLDEAKNLVETMMPMKPNLSIWLALLSGCRKHSNIEIAERAAENIFRLDPNCSAAYVLLSNMYAATSRWNDVARIRVKMKRRGNIKQPGCSWVNLKGTRHEFVSGDRSHPLCDQIYEKLEWLGKKLKEIGYVSDQRFALHDVEDEQKEAMLSHHSERLAICFALITTVEGSTIIVMKNLRVCGDCHSAIKLISKIVCREIVLRDSTRFHHFRDGFCSCSDYW